MFSTQKIRKACLLVVVCLAACTHRDPQAAFDHAQQTFQHGDLARAQEEAKRGYEDFHAVSPEWAWRFTILEANVLFWQGMNNRVLARLTSQPSPPPSGDLASQALRLEGLANASNHKFWEAEQKLKEAEGLCAGSEYPACGEVVRARGRLEMERGHFAQAQDYYEKTLTSARTQGSRFLEAVALLNLSWSAEEQTHFDEALDWADQARRLSVAQNFADVAQNALGNMGWAYYRLGDPEKAQAAFTEAKGQAEKLGDISDQVKWLLDAGYIYFDTGDFVAAEKSFRQSHDLAEKVKSREDIINALQALAFVSEQTNKLDEAKRYADEALSMARADGNKRDEVYPRLVQGRVAARQHDAATAEAAFNEVAQAPDSPVFLKWQAEHSLARLYEDENQPDAAAREYKTALSTFEEARTNLKKMDSRLPFLTNATAIYDDYIHFLVAQGKKDEALQVADFSRARTLSEGLGLLPQGSSFKPYPLNASQVARRAGGTILFYWLGEKQSYLWAISPQRTELFTLPPASEINAAVQRYRKALTGPEGAFEAAENDGAALYKMLVAPAEELLHSKAAGKNPHVSQNRRDMGHPIFIIPDGGLHSLNFETLLVPGSIPHYWIEDATISNANSLRLLASSRNGKTSTSLNLLLVGDAVTANADYPPLPKAALEMESIQKHFVPGQERVFAREQATPPAYLGSKPEQFSYIHFVAHGTASRLSPLESAIVLSKATSADDSFKLYARDIIHHRLRADLVTISACYGAGSRAYSGEGLVGLSWAFLGAGAHNVIGALWEVSDVSTPQLMDQLYDELRKGKSPGAALRAAKLSLLHSNSAFRKPFYWAPFQLYTGS
jgi:CHAT domain-containing protein